MKLNAIKCARCKDIVYSRARHDFRTCSCGNIFVDGGLDYFRYGSLKGGGFSIIDVEVDVDGKTLYKDWNEMIDKFGIIKGDKERK